MSLDLTDDEKALGQAINGLVPSENKPLHEPMIHVAMMASLVRNELRPAQTCPFVAYDVTIWNTILKKIFVSRFKIQ